MRICKCGLVSVTLSIIVSAISSPSAAQTPADYQALRKEIELLRQRQDSMQKEVDALKAQAPRPAPAVSDIVFSLDKAPLRGLAGARVTMVEVADFECPFCARYFRQTAPQILKDYVATGKIKYAFVHFPLTAHKYAFKGAEAGACAADQGRFWQMHDHLFGNPAMVLPAQLPQQGSAIGLNADAYRRCLDAGHHVSDVQSDMAMAQRAGVTATPTFFIGTMDAKTHTFKATARIVGAKPYATFQAALDSSLAAK